MKSKIPEAVKKNLASTDPSHPNLINFSVPSCPSHPRKLCELLMQPLGLREVFHTCHLLFPPIAWHCFFTTPAGLSVRCSVNSALLFCDLGRMSQAFASGKQLGNPYWINIFDSVPVSMPWML